MVELRLYYYSQGFDIVTGPGTVDSQVPITFTVHIWSSLVRPDVIVTEGSTAQPNPVVSLRPG